MDTTLPPMTETGETLARDGYAFVPAGQMRTVLTRVSPLTDWAQFAASWNDLETDTYMADGGRYRRRRHAVYAASRDGAIKRGPHQAHYQGRNYNHLNGGIARWFEPVLPEIGDGASMRTILAYCRGLFRPARTGHECLAHRDAPVPESRPASARKAVPRRKACIATA